jgi:hypothetical protein
MVPSTFYKEDVKPIERSCDAISCFVCQFCIKLFDSMCKPRYKTPKSAFKTSKTPVLVLVSGRKLFYKEDVKPIERSCDAISCFVCQFCIKLFDSLCKPRYKTPKSALKTSKTPVLVLVSGRKLFYKEDVSRPKIFRAALHFYLYMSVSISTIGDVIFYFGLWTGFELGPGSSPGPDLILFWSTSSDLRISRTHVRGLKIFHRDLHFYLYMSVLIITIPDVIFYFGLLRVSNSVPHPSPHPSSNPALILFGEASTDL